MLKIGVGPSSSHTMGPWKAAEKFVRDLEKASLINETDEIIISLYGSLALTGKGHGTDLALCMGLSGKNPESCDTSTLQSDFDAMNTNHQICLGGKYFMRFNPKQNILFYMDQELPLHSNGMRFSALKNKHILMEQVLYSIGGGFIVAEGEEDQEVDSKVPFPIYNADSFSQYYRQEGWSISQIARQNEGVTYKMVELEEKVIRIWKVMLQCMYSGCHTEGRLPGGLNVKRRASKLMEKLVDGKFSASNPQEWISGIQQLNCDFQKTLKWISCFAIATNEENANFGRVITAPTNGAAGVIPSVLMYLICFCEKNTNNTKIVDFLLTASEIGSLFKKGATISAAMGGCQAEIGVSSAMAAAALTEALGGSVDRVLMAAEIAMEHHLGITCDPIKGLVQIPCIERNSIGAMKAITASHIALESDPSEAKVSLDQVIQTMWETACDMNTKYKETSLGGLATNISVSLSEC